MNIVTKAKMMFTVVALLAAGAIAYQYLPSRQDEDSRNAITLTVRFSPNLDNSARNTVEIAVHYFPPDAPPEEYLFHRRISPWNKTFTGVSPGARFLFTAYRAVALTTLDCQVTHNAALVKEDNIPKNGMVNCDYAFG